MSRETDIAWCAGLFDGEGHVSYHRGYPSESSDRVSPQLYANVPQNSDNIEVLEEFIRIVGFGRLKGPYPTKKGTQHKVQFGVEEVQPLLILLKPYLKTKKTQDFQHALLKFMTHSPVATAEDYERRMKRDMKKYK